jgi:hypothetical protein
MSALNSLNPSVGYAGRIKHIAAAIADLQNGFIDWTQVLTTVINTSVTRWEYSPEVSNTPLMTFENPVNSNTGVVYERQLIGGGGRFRVTIEGVVDADNTNAGTPGTAKNTLERFREGSFIKADLYFNKTGLYGLVGVELKILNVRAGAIAGPDPNKFTVECVGDGAPPAPSYAT